jgi:hypothetical protein
VQDDARREDTFSCKRQVYGYPGAMPKPKTIDRSTVTDKNITFRASPRTRALLDALVVAAEKEAATIGASVSMGSYLKGLIEREATAKGIDVDRPEQPKGAQKPKR